MPTALFLSPHLDDVAFSCGGLVAQLGDAGWRTVMATAFTRSVPDPAGFALECQTSKGLAPEVDYMALRRGEDQEAAAILGTEPRWLDLPEAPHRGYHAAPALFGPILDGDDVWLALAGLLADLVHELQPALVLAPQGLGSHVDHRHLIAAVLALPHPPPLAFYRDAPYAIRNPDGVPGVGMPGNMDGRPTCAVGVAAGLDRKVRASCAYASQIGFQFGGPAALDGALRAFAAAEGDGAPAERFLGDLSGLPAGMAATVSPSGRTGHQAAIL